MNPKDFQPASDDDSPKAEEYFNARNQLFDFAKSAPTDFVQNAKGSGFLLRKEYSNFRSALVSALKKMAGAHGQETMQKVIAELREVAPDLIGSDESSRLFSQLELVLGERKKITIGIYDHAFHFAGGGQRYVASLAELLQDKYDITYIISKGGSLESYKEWFNIDLSRCRLKHLPIQFFEDLNEELINEGMAAAEKENPFDVIAQESLKYDVFINNNMLTKIEPRSLYSIFVGHFPDKDIENFFQVQKYDLLTSNADYSTYWFNKRWLLNPGCLLYPPVDMYNEKSAANKKQKIILSAARFETSGTKKQMELIKAFDAMCEENLEIASQWKLVLAGGNSEDNSYFHKVEKAAKASSANIELKPDAAYQELKDLYKNAAIFWHACGLNETSPQLVEHFGMTTVEAMQNYCVPIVINGGGQKEIVDHEACGYRFDNLAELQEYTAKVINDDDLRLHLAEQAYEKSHNFSLDVFHKHVLEIFEGVENQILAKGDMAT